MKYYYQMRRTANLFRWKFYFDISDEGLREYRRVGQPYGAVVVLRGVVLKSKVAEALGIELLT